MLIIALFKSFSGSYNKWADNYGAFN